MGLNSEVMNLVVWQRKFQDRDIQAVELLLLVAPIKVYSEKTVCRAERYENVKFDKERSLSEFKVVDKRSADKTSVIVKGSSAVKEKVYILHLGK